MAHQANHSSSEQGKVRRVLSLIWRFLRPLDADCDYTSDRIDRLERQVGRLKDELRQIRALDHHD